MEQERATPILRSPAETLLKTQVDLVSMSLMGHGIEAPAAHAHRATA